MHRHRPTLIGLLALVLVATGCAGSSTIDDYADQLTTDGPATTDDPGVPSDQPDTIDGTETDTLFGLPRATPPRPDPTPLPIDDDYRIGTLDNGLTYLLRSNDSPGSSLDLRLLVNAGSTQQVVGGDGSAHFLEHMMFNGTEAFPGNELSLALQRLGIAFGPDLNAYTSFDETVYLLGATTLDAAAPDLAFDVLAEWAAAATLDPAEVEAEIGVVRDELRQGRESVDGIIFTEFERIYTEGTGYEGRRVVGEPELVEATEVEVLRDFYDSWYRPDNMAVVVVGDLPLDNLERRVREHFEGIEARLADPPPRIEVDAPLSPEPRFAVVTHPDNGFDNLSLDFPLPIWDRATVGGDRLGLVEATIARMIQNRLLDAFQRGDLVIAQEPRFEEFSVARGLRYFGTNIQGGDLLGGLDRYLAELVGVAADGFTADDLDRARAELIAELDDTAATLESTQDWAFAWDLTNYWLDSADLDDPSTRIARHRSTLEALTTGELTNHWRWLLNSAGPIVIAVGADSASVPTVEEMADVVRSAQPAEMLAGAEAIDELMARPSPVEPAAENRRSTLRGNVYEWRYDNGVTVSFEHSDIDAGRFSLRSESTGGWLALDGATSGAGTAVSEIAVRAVEASGLAGFDAATVGRFLESRSAFVSGFIETGVEGFAAGAAADDAETLFQLLHQRVVGSQVDDVAFRTAINRAELAMAASDANVDLRAVEALIALATDNDERYATLPTPETLASLTPELLLDLYRARLGSAGGVHVAVVGDLRLGDVRDLADRYLGTLPTGPAESSPATPAPLPTGVRAGEVELSEGTADGGLIIAHLTSASLRARETATAKVLETVIGTRIVEDIREALGASYGGFATVTIEREPVPMITSVVQIDGDPARLDEIRNSILSSLAELATRGPDADEFARAKSVIEADWNFVNNGLFLADNLAATRFPDGDHLTPDNRLDILSAMSPTDVRDLAARLYGSGDRIEVAKVLP